MLSFDEALTHIQKNTSCRAIIEDTPLDICIGRYCSTAIHSPIDVPSEDNSAMDGFALRSADAKVGNTLRITTQCPAGAAQQKLPDEPLICARIFTGGVMPQGADAVIPQENVDYTDTHATLTTTATAQQFIRPRAEDFSAGDTLITAGTQITPWHLSVLAQAGINYLPTYRPLKLAVFGTGDELLAQGEPWQSGKLYDSNRQTMITLLKKLGFSVVMSAVIPDNLECTIRQLQQAIGQCDAIITCGGVSVGDHDHLRTAIDTLGQLTAWRVRMKPGKPIAIGTVGETPIVGLPGNPVSAVTTLLFLARPLLLLMQGATEPFPIPWRVPVGFSYTTHDRLDLLRVQLSLNDNIQQARLHAYHSQNSHLVSSLLWADGFAKLAPNQTYKAGDTVDFFPLHTLL